MTMALPFRQKAMVKSIGPEGRCFENLLVIKLNTLIMDERYSGQPYAMFIIVTTVNDFVRLIVADIGDQRCLPLGHVQLSHLDLQIQE